jgi:methylated-DNA-protein-cysteine methyltransferase-like protein
VGLGARPRGSVPPSPYARRVLDVVESIPPGKVMTYGDVAEYLGAGAARAVGNVMHHYGYEVAWWRVLLSTGHPAPSHPGEALAKLAAEGVPLLAGGVRVDLAAARWDGTRAAS